MGSLDALLLEAPVDPTVKDILESLEKDVVSRVMLVGKAGIGKTWMARKICEYATKVGSCYIVLWLSLNKALDEVSLYENIASQLSIFLDNEESEDDDSENEEKDQEIQDLMRLKERIHHKLDRKKFKGERKRKKYILLVLDDEGSITNEEKVMKDLDLGVFLLPFRPFKILLTRRKGEEDTIDKMNSDEVIASIATYELDAKSEDEIESHANSDGEIIESHTTDDFHAYSDRKILSHAMDGSHDLLDPHTIDASEILRRLFKSNHLLTLFDSLIDYRIHESLEKALWEVSKINIVRMSMGLPAAVVVLAKSINCISSKKEKVFSLSPKQEEVFKTVLSSFSDIETPTSTSNPILCLAYELLQSDDTVKSSIVDCFWHSLSFFEHCGCVHYQDLIAHWILEGYFDPVRSVTEAYKAGHDILIELINRGFLKIQEDNVVMPEVAMKKVFDHRRCGLSGTARISLAKVCGCDRTNGIGKINQVDDVIEAVQTTRKGETITTVLVSGNRLRRETPDIFFEKLKDVKILGLFKPTLNRLVLSLSKLVKLQVLVIRDCDLLKEIEELKALHGLHVLEVSGASSLKEISDDFFMEMLDLQSLHLSELEIKSSPSSISQLKKLHCLIIKDCPLLEDLPDIQELKELEVVDISGARGLQTCFDNTKGDKKNKSKNKNFYHLTKLQLLDFSESQIERLPIFQDSAVAEIRHSLTRLLLRNCSKLRRLPNLKPLSGLQILDLSGTSSLVKMLEVCFEDKKELRVLNLSGTNLRQLATTIEELSNLNELLLRDCNNIEAVPNIRKLTNLEVIDVSGCTKLEKIEGSFEDMSYLREVNLSGTKVETPELPKETKIHGPKRIILADGRSFEGKNWRVVKEKMSSAVSGDPSSSGAVVKSEEISEETKEIQSNDPRVSGCTEKGDISKERLLKVPVDKALYVKTLSFFDSTSPQEVMEINETNEVDDEAIANAESVSFVDCSSTRLTSIFNKTKSVKCCWLKMCIDITGLFSGVAEEHLKSLETLSITNLPSLEKISCLGNLENLKNLSLDCCPKIKTIFSEKPSSLQVLNVKHCENLEKVVEGVEVSTLSDLKWEVLDCPNFIEDYVMVEHSDAPPQD